MIKELKYYSKTTKNIFITINIIFVVLFFLNIVLYGTTANNDNINLYAKDFSLIGSLIFILFASFNLTIYNLELKRKTKIEKNILDYIDNNKYSEALNYINDISSKRNFYSVNQMLLYYLSYLELLNNNINKAIIYLKQFNLDKQALTNTLYLVKAIFLLYITNYVTKEDHEHIYNIYITKKEEIIKLTSRSKDKNLVKTLFLVIENINIKNLNDAANKLNTTEFNKIPLIKDFITNNK